MSEKVDKPVKQDQVVIVEGLEEGRNGDFITRIQGFVVIIKGSADLKKRYQIMITKIVYKKLALFRLSVPVPRASLVSQAA